MQTNRMVFPKSKTEKGVGKLKFKCIGTGSSGNCYVLENNDGWKLLLDIGLTWKTVLRGLDFNLEKLVGAVVTHTHQDHLNARTREELRKAGAYVWKPYELDNNVSRVFIGDFSVCSFPVPHDGVANVGYLIEADDLNILYVTDAEYVKYTFPNMDIIICECNYQEEYVDMEEVKSAHVFRGHMSLDTCADFIKANQTERLKNVILCHLSRDNANAGECAEKVREALGESVNVYVAEAGMRIEL
jgi:phosphoribosyl 1,2-cyclic phosphodiesterase